MICEQIIIYNDSYDSVQIIQISHYHICEFDCNSVVANLKYYFPTFQSISYVFIYFSCTEKNYSLNLLNKTIKVSGCNQFILAKFKETNLVDQI